MAKKKKLSFVKTLVCSIICLVIGMCIGVIGKNYIFALESYEIPATINSTHSVTEGDIDVDVISAKDLSIHFIELGNKYTGDCTLIKVGNTEVLVDAGSRADSVTPIYDYVSEYVSDNVLEYVIVTHAHQDHYAGFSTSANVDSLLDKFVTSNVITFAKTNQKETSTLYKNFNRELEETKTNNGTKVYTALECYNNTTDDSNLMRTIPLGTNVNLIILYQKYYAEKSSTENNYSVCFMIEQIETPSNKYYMFTGDLEADGEASLVEEYKNEYGVDLPQVELYKAGHHGSKTSSSDVMLSVIRPKIVCVCCCAGSSEYTKTNANQFPTQEFVNRIAPYTDQIFVTTLCIDYNNGAFESFNGNIIVSSNFGELVEVACANNSTILKDTEWFINNRTCPEAWQ